MSLGDMQRAIRRAVVDGDAGVVAPMLVGGAVPTARLSIHQRHYEASLVSAMLTRHPATSWLIGSKSVTAAARAFVRRHPPQAPCIAEYGTGFSAALAGTGIVQRVPYVASFAELDWHLGRVSVEIDRPPLPLEHLSSIEPARLSETSLTLQSGLHYLSANWPVDELMQTFVTESAPARMTLVAQAVRLEIRGARGSFRFGRLGEAEFAFRRSLQRGRPLSLAVESALRASDHFEPGPALAALFSAGLVVSTQPATREPVS